MSKGTSVLRLSSPAKINLWLRILGRRADGFHEIQSRLCKLALADAVQLERLSFSKSVTLTCSDPSVPTDESNLVMRALRLFEEATGTRHGWKIHLEKSIPAGAGLGGGSSNAATALKALNEVSRHPLAHEQLMELAARIGSDVPFFLLDATVADATGRGEMVTPAIFPWRLPVVIIKPPFPIPTPWAYQAWADSKELKGVLYAPQVCPWGAMVNDLERPVFQKHLLLPALKSRLLECGATTAALMSGSGSVVFAVTSTAVASEEVAALARDWCGTTSSITVTHTLPCLA